MRRPIIRGGPWKNWTEPTIDVSLETRERPSSLLSIGTLSPLLYIPRLWLISRHSHRLIFSASRRPRPPPYPGAPANPASCGRGDAAPHGPAPSFSSLHCFRGSSWSVANFASPPSPLSLLSPLSYRPARKKHLSRSADARTGVKMTRGTSVRGLHARHSWE